VSILLVQGGLKAHRGLPEVAGAAGHLPPGWAVVMMGDGELRDSLEAAALELGAHGDGIPRLAVIPAAPLAELPLWTAGAAIGLIPYEKQGINHWFCTPNKLWEYPCAGVPVLASPFPEMRAMITRHGFGWLLAPDWDGPALAAQVAGLDPEDLARRRERCAEFMAQENWDKYGSRLLGLYERLLS
jgi:glycosyltransferase involved in cell wall biosynthesis